MRHSGACKEANQESYADNQSDQQERRDRGVRHQGPARRAPRRLNPGRKTAVHALDVRVEDLHSSQWWERMLERQSVPGISPNA